MSEERFTQNITAEYAEPASEDEELTPEAAVLSPEAQEFAAKIEERRLRNRQQQKRRKKRNVVIMVLVFAVLLTMCSREIVRLQAENRALKKQHAELEQERDRLAKELGNVGDKEYIKEQARKQLKLLDPGEIMFVFEDGSSQQDKSDNKDNEDNQDKEENEDKAAEDESGEADTEEEADE